MADYFVLLDEPRRPWLDPELLKKKFLALSAELHPDKVHSANPTEKATASKRFAELNSAYNCLREPKERLRHLLELELGSKPKDLQQIPPDLADLFMEIGALCKQVDGFLAEKAKTSSSLLRAQLFERGQEWAGKLIAMQLRIAQRNDTLISRLRSLDARWTANSSTRSTILPQLEEVWRLLGFFTRWSGQIQERLAQIAF
jgi:DnaJ-domain-containing protein 1